MTRATLILFGHSLRRVKTLVGVIALVLAAFQVLASLMSATFEESQAFARITALVPGFIKQAMGASVLGMLSFTGVVCLGYFHFAVVGVLVGLAIAVATEPASERDSGFADLVLARPVTRHAVIARSSLLIIVCAGFVVGMMTIGTWVGLAWLAPPGAAWPAPRIIVSLAANLTALMLCWGGVALAVGTATHRRSTAAGIAGVLALGLFLFDYVARVWRPAKPLAWLSPFHYYDPVNLVLGHPLPPSHLWVLVGIGIVGAAIAHIVYAKRDI
jgi:ABC-2 type transport system permease protein